MLEYLIALDSYSPQISVNFSKIVVHASLLKTAGDWGILLIGSYMLSYVFQALLSSSTLLEGISLCINYV